MEKISTYIRNDLRSRILSGEGVPAKWTLPSLAERYKVSAMPVRVALRELLAENLLNQLDNGRFTVNPSQLASRKGQPVAKAPQPPVDRYLVVVRDILERSLRGDADPLKIAVCADRFAVSHSLMHTILHRLAGMGVVEHAPRKGWTIRPFRQQDLDAYVEVREALELLALDSARDRLDDDRLRALLELNQPSTRHGPERIDNSLHAYWVEKSGNRYIQDFFKRHQPYYDLLLEHTLVKRQQIDDSKESHRNILKALLRRDWNAARSELSRDIHRLSPLLKATIQKLEPLAKNVGDGELAQSVQ